MLETAIAALSLTGAICVFLYTIANLNRLSGSAKKSRLENFSKIDGLYSEPDIDLRQINDNKELSAMPVFWSFNNSVLASEKDNIIERLVLDGIDALWNADDFTLSKHKLNIGSPLFIWSPLTSTMLTKVKPEEQRIKPIKIGGNKKYIVKYNIQSRGIDFRDELNRGVLYDENLCYVLTNVLSKDLRVFYEVADNRYLEFQKILNEMHRLKKSNITNSSDEIVECINKFYELLQHTKIVVKHANAK